ncbi:MAG: hypothetical protein JWM19_7445 [Actinomycetia bacterium]|nr:hypothetical protein [Actinomycetes bacterium]
MARAGVEVLTRGAVHADAALAQPRALIGGLPGHQGGKLAVALGLLAGREDEQPGLERRGDRDAGRAVGVEAD